MLFYRLFSLFLEQCPGEMEMELQDTRLETTRIEVDSSYPLAYKGAVSAFLEPVSWVSSQERQVLG